MNLLGRHAAGKISQTDESAFEVGRNLATHRRLGGVRKRAVPADPVQAAHGDGARAAAADRAALHQQVLHPRPAAGELAGRATRSSRATGVPDFVAQRRIDRSAHKTWDDYIDEGVLAGDRRRCSEISGSRTDQHARLLRRRHACSRRRWRCSPRAANIRRASMTLLTAMLDFSRYGRARRLRRRSAGASMREQTIGGKNGAPADARQRIRQHVLVACAERPGVELRRRQLPEGRRTPAPFDLLYWNSDRTNLPGPMYVWYLRNTYLREPSARAGRVDRAAASRSTSSKIDVPTFIYGSREDHIVPWHDAYALGAAPERADADSCSARRATSPA